MHAALVSGEQERELWTAISKSVRRGREERWVAGTREGESCGGRKKEGLRWEGGMGEGAREREEEEAGR